MNNVRQRQRHGVTKHIVEGLGGAIVGAAVVLFIRNRLKARSRSETQHGTEVEAPGVSAKAASE